MRGKPGQSCFPGKESTNVILGREERHSRQSGGQYNLVELNFERRLTFIPEVKPLKPVEEPKSTTKFPEASEAKTMGHKGRNDDDDDDKKKEDSDNEVNKICRFFAILSRQTYNCSFFRDSSTRLEIFSEW